jgi:hypothetical protein
MSFTIIHVVSMYESQEIYHLSRPDLMEAVTDVLTLRFRTEITSVHIVKSVELTSTASLQLTVECTTKDGYTHSDVIYTHKYLGTVDHEYLEISKRECRFWSHF